MLDLSLGSNVYISNIWDAAVQELDLIFYTTNTELIGHPEFGTNFDDFLWTLSPTSQALSEYIEQKFNDTVFISQLQHSINVQYAFNSASYENVYTVTVVLYDDYYSVEKTYQLNEQV